MNPDLEKAIVEFLREQIDIFAWHVSNMTGIDPSVIVYKLNVDPNAPPVK